MKFIQPTNLYWPADFERKKMITRKAILLKYTKNDLEDYRTDLDFGLVKAFLKSAAGGCFKDNEIVEFITNDIEGDVILREIDQVDYSFVYFTGQAHFIDRATWLPLKNDVPIRVSDLQRKNKKQWFFFDCSRVNSERIQSPEFSFERNSIHFPASNELAQQQWMQDLASLPNDVCITYYTTEMGKHAYVNEQGGYGTQIFFSTLSGMIKSKALVKIEELITMLNFKEVVNQKAVLFTNQKDIIIFRN